MVFPVKKCDPVKKCRPVKECDPVKKCRPVGHRSPNPSELYPVQHRKQRCE